MTWNGIVEMAMRNRCVLRSNAGSSGVRVALIIHSREWAMVSKDKQ